MSDKISIIIGALNHLDDCTKPCIESIRKYTDMDKVEIVLVGNGCTDGTKEWAEAQPDIRYLDFPEPMGYAGANNLGLSVAQGDYFILLNNDVIILEQERHAWVDTLLAPFKAPESKCGISGPLYGYSDPADAHFLVFFCVMVSRKCYEAIGPLDTIYREGGGEDTAYCIEARRAGFDVVQVPQGAPTAFSEGLVIGNFPVYHKGEATVYDLPNWQDIFQRNSQILRVKYNRRWKLSNDSERAVIGKSDMVPPRETTRYQWARRNIVGTKILEIGCSSGYGLRFFGDIPGLNYTGIDYDPAILEYARENFGRDGVTFQQGDITKMNFLDYDTIIAFEVLEHVDNGKELAQELKKHCKRLLISLPYNETPGLWGRHHRLHRLKESDFPGFDYCCIDVNGNLGRELIDQQGLSLLTMKWPQDPGVSVVISTKNRYNTTLPLVLTAIANQTYMPKAVYIFDDGEHRNLSQDPLYKNIFSMLAYKGVKDGGIGIFGERKGQVLNHIKSLSIVETEWIWRLDDDTVPEADALERLVGCIGDDVAAVGGIVVNSMQPKPRFASNRIEDIYCGVNEQWYHQVGEPKVVDHLYSSFIYRKSLANYPTQLSIVGHREETILTYEMTRQGYKCIFQPAAKTWHFHAPEGGIRSTPNPAFWQHDEELFIGYLHERGVKPNRHTQFVLPCGLGDHLAFRSILPEYRQKYDGFVKTLFVAYPDVFSDCPDIRLGSIADAKDIGINTDEANVYYWMESNGWKGTLRGAFAKMCGVEESPLPIGVPGNTNMVLISPYSHSPDHAKSYPYWPELIKLLQDEGYFVFQVGVHGEPALVPNPLYNCAMQNLKELATQCRFWISVDNFFPHLVNNMTNPIQGCVLWGESDPEIYGYDYNLNLLRDRSYLRPDQFGIWQDRPRNPDAFMPAEQAFKAIKCYWREPGRSAKL